MIKLFRIITGALFTAYVFYLTLLTMNTTLINFPHEAYMTRDNPLKFFVAAAVITGLVVVSGKCSTKTPDTVGRHAFSKGFTIATVTAVFLFSLWIALSLKAVPHGDQELICAGAAGLVKYDFSLFTRGQYFDFWPFQSRIATLIWGVFSVFGEDNYLVLQLIDVVAITASVYLVARIWTEGAGKNRGVLHLAATAAFLPLYYFSVYVYGNIPGLALSLLACLLLVRYRKTHSPWALLGTAVSLAAGLVIKNTYLIVLAAVIIFLFLDVLEQWQGDRQGTAVPEQQSANTSGSAAPEQQSVNTRGATVPEQQSVNTRGATVPEQQSVNTRGSAARGQWTVNRRRAALSAAGIVLVLLMNFAAGRAVDAVTESRLGFKLSKGSPMLAWITMAFQEEENGNPVKYNAYNRDVYVDNDCNTDAASEQAFRDLKDNIKRLLASPSHTLDFMGRKMEWCWADPVYDGLVEVNKGEISFPRSEAIRAMIRCSGDNIFLKYCNLLQTVTLMGALLFGILRFRKAELPQLLFPLIFVGGFTFQLFWESIALYGLQYMLLLMPVAVEGYAALGEELGHTVSGSSQNLPAGPGHMIQKPGITASQGRKIPMQLIATAGTFTLIAIFTFADFRHISLLIRPHYDNTAYAERMNEIRLEEEKLKPQLADGIYLLKHVQTGFEIKVTVHTEYGKSVIRYHEDGLLVSRDYDAGTGVVTILRDTDDYLWDIRKTPEGYITISDCGTALSSDGEKLTAVKESGAAGELWGAESRT